MNSSIAPKLPPIEPDAARFEQMIEATERRAYRMALHLTRNRTDAEDLVQDTYAKAWRGFESYTPGRPFLNWLLRIMQRSYLDSLRRENPIRRAESLNAMISPSDGEVQELQIPARDTAPDEEMLQQEFAKELQAALSDLPEVYQTAIRLCDLEERSYQEIAEIQGTTVGTVRSRIHRGRKLLREIALERGLSLPSSR
jgi:RNA polymerase sigma-70 factor, ECF subfamily